MKHVLLLLAIVVGSQWSGYSVDDPYVLEESVRRSAITKAKKLIRGFESLRLTAYLCPGGQVTIGYGHTGPYCQLGDRITVDKAEELLEDDMSRFVDMIDAEVKVPLTDGQAAALTSLAFNIGIEAFRRSTLLKRLNDSLYPQAADEILRWNKIKGKVSKGLTNRRESEKAVFEEADIPF